MCVSAAVVCLPGAAAEPVTTPKMPRGRPPKNVTSISPGSWYRAMRLVRMAKAAELEAHARRHRDAAARMPEFMNAALRQAAQLEAEARVLRGPSR